MREGLSCCAVIFIVIAALLGATPAAADAVTATAQSTPWVKQLVLAGITIAGFTSVGYIYKHHIRNL